jgi:glycosyltransferase involved in cell wall biosynthesis
MRVLHVANLKVSLLNFAVPLEPFAASDGVEFHYACSDAPDIPRWSSIQLNRGPASLAAAFLRTPDAVRGCFENDGADLVHVHTPAAAFRLRRTLADRPAVFTSRGGFDEGGSIRTWLWSWINPARWGTWRAVGVLNRSQYKGLMHNGHLRLLLLSSGGCGLSADVFDSMDDVQDRASRRAKRADWRLLWVGRLDKDKNLEAFLSLVVRLRRRGIAVSARVCGDALPGDRGGQQLQRVLERAPHVEWHGWSDDISTYYRWADALILTSKREGFGMTPLEAAARGTPTVGYWTNGTAESVLAVGGVLTPQDEPSLEAAVCRVLGGNLANYVRTCVHARYRAEAYSRDRLWKDVLHMYNLATS